MRFTAPILVALLTILLILAALDCIVLSEFNFNIGNISNILLYKSYADYSFLESIIFHVRIPRILCAILLSINLAISGIILQSITKNPIACPSILGISQSAVLGLIIGIIFCNNAELSNIFFTMLGCTVGSIIITILNSMTGGMYTPIRFILTGVALSIFLSSLVSLLIVLHSDVLGAIVYFVAGNLQGLTWLDVFILLPSTIFGAIFAFCISHHLNLLELGDDIYRNFGYNPSSTRFTCIAVIIIIFSVSISIAGSIAFMSLIAPHIARAIFGSNNKIVVVSSVIIGPILMLVSDIFARLINFPFETPVGIITALAGTPVFLFLVMKKARLIQ